MARKRAATKPTAERAPARAAARRPSSLLDTRIIYCGDCVDQLAKLPDGCVDLIYIDPPFNSNRNYEVFWGETKEKRAFEDRHGSTRAYIDYMRPRCVELARVLKKTGSFYYHCDWHASHYVKVMLDQIFGEKNFINEIIWKRQSAHSDAKQGSKHLGRIHDSIFLYTFGGSILSITNTGRIAQSIFKTFTATLNRKPVGAIGSAISRRRAARPQRRGTRTTSFLVSQGTGGTAKRT